jgi:hypothetical protein
VSIPVFVGPTLRPKDIAAVLESEALCLPPVAQGDVYRVARARPRAIGIIDGYFSGAPSVWHKEILWALSQGIAVFGSASMGALRAAELHRFGMQGVGRIFEAFRDGILEDDDEVAVIHGPTEVGYVSASEAMVNIRATLARAEDEGVLSRYSRRTLEAFAKSQFFPRRNWSEILESAQSQGVPAAEVIRLRDWLPRGRVDQKREDALAMLAMMRDAPVQDDAPQRFRFEWTNFWNQFVAQAELEPWSAKPSSQPSYKAILEELRLEGRDAYARVRDRALLRLFANLEAKRRGLEASAEAKHAALSRMRLALGLFNRAALDDWLFRNHVDASSLDRLIEDEARAESAIGPTHSWIDQHLLDELRLSGAYERMAQRAREKQKQLEAPAQDHVEPTSIVANSTSLSLRLWFFEQQLGRPIPDNIDAFVLELGFAEVQDFDDALRREWSYSQLTLG